MMKEAKNNDVFAKQIHSEDPKYDGRYFLFIRSIVEEYQQSKEFPMYRVKITDQKEIPKSEEEINKLEYIQLGIEDEITAIDDQKKEYARKQTLYPDEFGYVPLYRESFMPLSERKYPEDIVYLGNFDITPPAKEYIWDDSKYYRVIVLEEVDTELIERYKTYNLRDTKIYNHELAEIRRNNYRMHQQILEEVERHSKEILEKYGDEINKILENEPYIEDSLTYVGSDEEDIES